MGSYNEYNFGTTARKYDLQEEASLSVMHGAAAEQAPQTVPVFIAKAVKVLAIVIAVVCVLGVIRISLGSATIATAMEYNEVNRAIENARTEGAALELQKSQLANPGRIKKEAIEIGMSSPRDTTFIDLSGDVVVTDADGNLSLSGSMAAAA